MELNQAFGQVLRSIRLEKSLTHEALAERAGLHPTFISLLERGGRMPSLNTVFLIAKALGMKSSELIEHVEKLKPRPHA
ncbi:MAG TPA: helix-turn-helix transcriptional regulator [Rariglobus sp.]